MVIYTYKHYAPGGDRTHDNDLEGRYVPTTLRAQGQKSGFEPDSTHSQRVVFPLHHICTPHTGIEPVSRPSRGRMLSDTPIGQHPIRELNPSQLVRSQLCCPIHQWGMDVFTRHPDSPARISIAPPCFSSERGNRMGLKRLELSSCDLESHCFPISDSPHP